MQASRDRIQTAHRTQASHAGLVLNRYLVHAVPTKNASEAEKKAHQDDKRQLHRDATTAATASLTYYALAYHRWKESLPSDTSIVLPVQGRLIVGLGGDNVLETGIALHHTYGVPMIPGSALKGLAAHYCDQVWGLADPKFRKARGKKDEAIGAYHEVLFGATDDSGHITFHDAWIIPDSIRADGTSGLVLDVMTPHHSDYYSDKTYESGAKKGDLIPPTDFDGPTPITFLSVAGAFHIAVSCDVLGEAGGHWAKLAFDLLKEALREWGVGGKTSSGYGRLTVHESVPATGRGSPHGTTVPRSARPSPPKSGERVETVLLEERTKKGLWRAKHEPTGLDGPVQNTGDVPPDKNAGDKLMLIVASVNDISIAFRYPTSADEQRAQASKKKTIGRPDGQRPPKGGLR